VLTALAAAGPPAGVPATWLNAFPQGSDFAPPRIAGFGRRVPAPGGGTARIGQVFTTTPAAGGAPQYYVLRRDGLEPVTRTEAALLNAARGQLPQAAVAPSVVADHRAGGSISAAGLPQRMPSLVGYDPAAPLCVVYSGPASARGSAGRLTVGGTVPAGGLPDGVAGSHTQIDLPPGKAALAAVVPGPERDRVAVTGYFLISGGRRYGLASPGVAAMLGYQLKAQRTLVPASVLDLIPPGPALDPAAARQQAGG
jgi:hypothetical protein